MGQHDRLPSGPPQTHFYSSPLCLGSGHPTSVVCVHSNKMKVCHMAFRRGESLPLASCLRTRISGLLFWFPLTSTREQLSPWSTRLKPQAFCQSGQLLTCLSVCHPMGWHFLWCVHLESGGCIVSSSVTVRIVEARESKNTSDQQVIISLVLQVLQSPF